MKPELAAEIAAANAAEAERAQEAAQKTSQADGWGDFAVQLDNAGQIVELAVGAGRVIVNGVSTAGECIATVCDAIPTLD